MEKEIARLFWGNVQYTLRGKTFKSFCEENGLNYLSLANRKSGANPSLPRLDTAYQIASSLGVSVEFLLTGKERISNPRLDAILNTLMADPDKLDAVEVLLFGKKAGASSKFS